jgi:hypothetical protein
VTSIYSGSVRHDRHHRPNARRYGGASSEVALSDRTDVSFHVGDWEISRRVVLSLSFVGHDHLGHQRGDATPPWLYEWIILAALCSFVCNRRSLRPPESQRLPKGLTTYLATGVVPANSYRPPRSEWRDHLGDRPGRQKRCASGTNPKPASAGGCRLVEAPADRLATLTVNWRQPS